MGKGLHVCHCVIVEVIGVCMWSEGGYQEDRESHDCHVTTSIAALIRNKNFVNINIQKYVTLIKSIKEKVPEI